MEKSQSKSSIASHHSIPIVDKHQYSIPYKMELLKQGEIVEEQQEEEDSDEEGRGTDDYGKFLTSIQSVNPDFEFDKFQQLDSDQ